MDTATVTTLRAVYTVLLALVCGEDKAARKLFTAAVASSIKAAGLCETPEAWVVHARKLAPAVVHVFSPARHEHDCAECHYLGQHGEADLYLCPRDGSALARTGRDGDYQALPAAMVQAMGIGGPQGEVVRRAEALGLPFPADN